VLSVGARDCGAQETGALRTQQRLATAQANARSSLAVRLLSWQGFGGAPVRALPPGVAALDWPTVATMLCATGAGYSAAAAVDAEGGPRRAATRERSADGEAQGGSDQPAWHGRCKRFGGSGAGSRITAAAPAHPEGARRVRILQDVPVVPM
jgi:hypothetical protein